MQRCVLVVEDDELLRLFYKHLLGDVLRVVEVCRADEALAMVLEHRPSVVLMDVDTGGALNGFDALSLIRSNPLVRDTAVAMVTARDDKQDFDRAKRLRASAYFVKPFSPADLFSWVYRTDCEVADGHS